MGHCGIRDKMKNPLLDVNEDTSVRPFQSFSFFEKIGLAGSLIFLTAFLIISSLSFYTDFIIKSNFIYSLLDLFIIVVCLNGLYFILNSIKRKIITDVLIDTAFQEGVYSRLEPLVENLAQTRVDTDIILDRISNIDLKVENIQKERYTRDIKSSDLMEEPIALGTSIKFAIKAVFLIILTMAAFMFLVNFNLGGITPYSVLLIFIAWWIFITNEYKLWKEPFTWTMVFLPILVIPVTVMLLNNLLNYNVMMATVYIFVGFYTFIYYIWAVYATSGSLPITIAKEKEPVKSEFFALQQKGMVREFFEVVANRLRQRLEKEEKHEPKLAWKK